MQPLLYGLYLLALLCEVVPSRWLVKGIFAVAGSCPFIQRPSSPFNCDLLSACAFSSTGRCCDRLLFVPSASAAGMDMTDTQSHLDILERLAVFAFLLKDLRA